MACPLAQILHSKTFFSRWIETDPIVGDDQFQMVEVFANGNSSFRGLGVFDQVVEQLLEYKEGIAAKIERKTAAESCGRIELKMDAKEHAPGKIAKSFHEVFRPIMAGVNQPDDFAHGIERFAGGTVDFRKCLLTVPSNGFGILHDSAQERYASQVTPNFVMEI